MKCKLKITTTIMAIIFICFCLFIVHPALADKCLCYSPCKGSRTCPNGCWAFCEERQSGPYCIKGCVYDIADMREAVLIRPEGKLNTVDIKMPKEQVQPLLERLFGVALKASFSSSKSEKVEISLRDVTLRDIIETLKTKGVSLQTMESPAKNSANAVQSVILKITNDKGLASRLVGTLSTEDCSFVCYEWECQPNPGGTIHCECKRGEMVCSKGK